MSYDEILIFLDRYNELIEAEAILKILYEYGVEDWDGYDIAMGAFEDESKN